MKLSDILAEMPTDLNKDAPFVFNIDGSYISNNSLKRDFNFLGDLKVQSTNFKFWLNKKNNRALVTSVAESGNAPELKDGNGESTNIIVVDLHLKNNSEVEVSNPIQVDTVSVNSKYESIGLSGILYVVLARYGFSVISDFEQYNGGVGLWKKISRYANQRKYVVRIWNIRNGEFVVDNNGLPLAYDEKNLQQDQVWNKIGQQTETLLVLSSK
jgi:hypothetical protein